MKLTEDTVCEKNLYKGKVIELYLQKVRLSNGKCSDREIVKHPGGVAIIAFKDKETILMVEQYRKPLERVLIELPAGKIELGERTEECGKRELEEETGYKAREFTYLGKIATSPGFCNEYIYFYKAEDLYKGKLDRDEDEFINIKEVKINDIKEMIIKGIIIDAKTISAFMYL
ncbi:ADP-ribose pyrophosphatase [Clostridium pasteurianum DSM 525 = ATCC 6013]|uniref:ADP-ribose pyrophosphatase n=1 Tax=Clostridium pasteurianum DSM 525 = ATCC 6013 TaxID=1262449 RepID=A0A0H3J7W0_CLOPA|nr:NUDIX hydrolase [Clostridium pasteurianum]AJA47993.1 ADP-ribose pyrophosphatase [Clostridium pasteurianum DSM 525 = ATCC 6013]AJA51981.1 ADP-ribose pyrophosphatase [Clostridium pasteurianum DSM 525 = ATCC 6013]AOZ75278.1 ADP-ribose pyrophosphatase [Clostridium pasteurianum DSM 525 = ATCC 6013]AOZ79073.1 ADP-ribose pyrophosphatase [Clostridium pasteurianum]ELP59896.1 ADP-ribose pyrophosphatase [Clostridium pasteurianum DSM 525 = ATCC 6013]